MANLFFVVTKFLSIHTHEIILLRYYHTHFEVVQEISIELYFNVTYGK